MKVPSSSDLAALIVPQKPDQNPESRLGTVTANFVNGGAKVPVLLDGEDTEDSYVCMSNYYPLVGDRVVLKRHGSTWIITGSVDAANYPTMQAGLSPSFGPTGGTGANVNVTFPVPFATLPVVVLSFGVNASSLAGWSVKLGTSPAPSTTGFNIQLSGTTSLTFTTQIHWIAMIAGTY